jgi:glycosyltransferase involved in cell wall biosynthesis
MPHRILMLSHHGRSVLGGAPLADLALAQALRDEGHEVDALFFEEVLPPTVRATWRLLVFPWAAALHFLRRWREGQWDVLESTAGDAWIISLLIRLFRLPRPLLSVRTHGLEHRRADMDRERKSRDRKPPGLATRLYHYHYRLWEVGRDLRSADVVFLLNQEDERYAEEHLSLRPEVIHILPNGLRDEVLKMGEPEGGTDQVFHLLFLGLWSPIKGAELLPRIAKRLFAADPRFRLTCAGVQEWQEKVLADFAPADRDRVEVIVRYEGVELLELLVRHGVFVFPSPAEGCSLALLEAMAGGLVPVTVRTGYAGEIIKPGRNGFLVEAGDVDGFVDHILTLAADPKTALVMGRAARQSVSGHGWSNRARERVRIWDEIARVKT